MFLAARHSPAADSEEGKCHGQTEIPVQHAHHEAATKIRKALPADFQPSVIFSSDLKRCAELAEEVAPHFPNAELKIDPRLREIHFGEWEGKSWDTIEAQDAEAFNDWMENWITRCPPGDTAESAEVLLERVREWHTENSDSLANALLIGHAGPIRALLQIAEPSLTWNDVMALQIPHLEKIDISQR